MRKANKIAFLFFNLQIQHEQIFITVKNSPKRVGGEKHILIGVGMPAAREIRN